MSSNWPTSIDNFGHVNAGEATNEPNNAGLTHSAIHNLLADAIIALETHLQGGTDTDATPTLIGATDPFQAPFSGNNAGNTALGSNALGIVSVGGSGNGNQTNATAIGYAALDNIIGNHSNNTAVGFGAANQYLGNFGTAIGADALYAALGDRNTGIGVSAGSSANGFSFTGSDNVSVGYQALHGALAAATSGSSNVVVGSQAMANATGASFDVAIGYQALMHEGNGPNTAIGYQALQTNTTGVNNTATGYQSLQANTTGQNNIAIGYQSLHANTSGFRNTATGYQALTANTIGNDNIAIGATAGSTWTNVNSTIVIGISAGQNIINNGIFGPPDGDIAIGYQALQNDVFGGNVAIGYQAMQIAGANGQGSGGDNVAVGYQAALALTSGADNVIVGAAAGSRMTTAGSNVIVGNIAGKYLTTGSNNIFIGWSAGPESGLGAVGSTVSIGAATDASNAVAIGSNGSTFITSAGTYGIAIGAGTVVNAAGAVAIGVDHLGTAATSSTQDLIVIGTTNHTTQIQKLALNATQTVLSGTSLGSATWSQPYVGNSYKKVIVFLSGYENTTITAQTITFPTAFTNTPYLAHDDSGGSTVSTTTLTLPASMGATKTGWIVIEGY